MPKRITWLLSSFLFLLFSFSVFAQQPTSQDVLIEDVEFRGNRRIPPRDQDWRCAFALAEQRRVIGRIVEQIPRACPLHRGNFPLNPVCLRRLIARAAAPGEIGQRIKRRARAAETAEQLRVAYRADVGYRNRRMRAKASS